MAKDMASNRGPGAAVAGETREDAGEGSEAAADVPTPLAILIPSMERASLEILDDCEELEELMAKHPSIIAFFADVYAGVNHHSATSAALA